MCRSGMPRPRSACLARPPGAWVVVDETEFVVVTEFGRIVAVYGDEPARRACTVKWPWHRLTIDRRLQVFDPPPREVITGDKRNLEVAGYVVWRVGDPVAFLRSAGDARGGRGAAGRAGRGRLSDAIGRRDARRLASTDAAVWRLDALTREVARGRRARRRGTSWASRWSTSGCGGSTTRSRSGRPSST